MIKAVLVIDMQNICVGKNHSPYFKYDRDNLITEVNRVIADNKDNLIVYIKNVMKKNLINRFAPFKAYEKTEAVELVEELSVVSDYVFEKYTGNAFTNNGLNNFLSDNKVDTVELIGVDGGGCVFLTAIGAIEKGYKVIVNTKAVGTISEKNRDNCFKKLEKLGVEFI
ncbi:MAG: isochorismatase family cysteine hydrolase [Acutalibacteraceae bacterium]|nr:isochorismatase family cysteine hydrolase [Acutalibacteraceae bacterium]